MKATKRTSLTYIGLFALLAAVSGFSSGQAKSPVTRELVWSFPESEIASPQFLPSQKIIRASRFPDNGNQSLERERLLKRKQAMTFKSSTARRKKRGQLPNQQLDTSTIQFYFPTDTPWPIR
jgi:hypothetical protein